MPKLTQEERDALLKVRAIFDAWWESDGQFLDPDTDDVPWFDKRRDLAAMAFIAGIASVGNTQH